MEYKLQLFHKPWETVHCALFCTYQIATVAYFIGSSRTMLPGFKLTFSKWSIQEFESRLSKFCGRQPLQDLKGYGLFKHVYSL